MHETASRSARNAECNVRSTLAQLVGTAPLLAVERPPRHQERHHDHGLRRGTDAVGELEELCKQIARRFRRPAFFAGKLVFREENFLTRRLHNQAAMAIQRRLQFAGLQMMVLPVRAL